MDQSSSFSRTYESLTLNDEIKNTVCKLGSKVGGLTESEAITMDVLISSSMTETTLDDMTIRGFRDHFGIEFDFNTLKRRLDRKMKFDQGDLGALIDDSKWDDSGNWWSDEAIGLFRKFYQLPSPAVYIDHTGRKIHFTNFDGEDEYDFMYGLNPKSTFD